jgi:hypothetical protein
MVLRAVLYFVAGKKFVMLDFLNVFMSFKKNTNWLNSGEYFRKPGLPEIALDHIFVDFDDGSRFFRLRQFFFRILGLDL